MKVFLISMLVGGSCLAEFESWTSKDGRSADLDLKSVSETEGEKVGEFLMRNGRSTKLKASQLSAESAAKLAEWKPLPDEQAAVTQTTAPSVFDDILDGNLLRLSGKSLKSCKDATKPAKYYLFYYSASWCGPCHKFTPSLVDFYNKNKDDSFELVLITSDSGEDEMEEYSAEFKMPWPQLKLSKVEKFKKAHKYPGGGIPNLVLTDLEGNLIKGSYEGNTYVGPTVVMNHLTTLLKK